MIVRTIQLISYYYLTNSLRVKNSLLEEIIRVYLNDRYQDGLLLHFKNFSC